MSQKTTVEVTKQEADLIAKKTEILKFRILSEMVDWTDFKTLVDLAEQEYNNLRTFVGENYPKENCNNILKLFRILKECEV